jgi:hypothetical protein
MDGMRTACARKHARTKDMIGSTLTAVHPLSLLASCIGSTQHFPIICIASKLFVSGNAPTHVVLLPNKIDRVTFKMLTRTKR